jgi:hypothetical protein
MQKRARLMAAQTENVKLNFNENDIKLLDQNDAA